MSATEGSGDGAHASTTETSGGVMSGPRYSHLFASCVAVVAFVGTSVGTAHAAPAANGCPRSYELLSVADLTAQGYLLPAQLDDPSSGTTSHGSPGNGDGYVCGKELGPQTTPWGAQLYNFWDNNQHA
jgi:hypothetical protein